MIQSWDCKDAKAIFEGKALKGVAEEVARAARRRLARVNEAVRVEDLRTPPGHRLHKIGPDTWSLSVNMQYRITFKWGDLGPQEVWFGDYH